MAELHLYPAGPQVGVAQLVPRAVHIQDDALVVRLDQPAGELPLPRGHRDQAADVAPPVARVGQRPVDAGRTDLEDVLPLAELAARLLRRVQRGRTGPDSRRWSAGGAAAQSVPRRTPPWGQRRSEGGTECVSSPRASERGRMRERADGATRYHALAGMVFTYAGADGAGTITPGGARQARRYRRRRRARRLLAELRQAEAAPGPTPADLGAGRHPGARRQVPGDHRPVPGPRRAAAAAARRPSGAPRRAAQGDGPAGAVGLPLDPGGQRCRRSGRRGRGAEGRRAVRPDRGGDRLPGGIRAVRPAARLDRGLPGDPRGSAVRMSAATDALAAALAAEHAAIFGYGVVGARLTGAATGQAREAESAHRARRDKLVVQLTKAGTTPPAAQPAYALPFPVGDAAGAQKLAGQMEEPPRAILRTPPGPTPRGDRKLAPDALIDCAQRAARWRRATGQEPGTGPLPQSCHRG